MGQNISIPLNLTLEHLKEVKTGAHNLSVETEKQKWKILCTSEWPTFQIEWPTEGSFSLPLILTIKRHIFGTSGQSHPDKVPYIVTWSPTLPHGSALLFLFQNPRKCPFWRSRTDLRKRSLLPRILIYSSLILLLLTPLLFYPTLLLQKRGLLLWGGNPLPHTLQHRLPPGARIVLVVLSGS